MENSSSSADGLWPHSQTVPLLVLISYEKNGFPSAVSGRELAVLTLVWHGGV